MVFLRNLISGDADILREMAPPNEKPMRWISLSENFWPMYLTTSISARISVALKKSSFKCSESPWSIGCILTISNLLEYKRSASGIKDIESLWPSHPGKKITFLLKLLVWKTSINWELDDLKISFEEIEFNFFLSGFCWDSLNGLDANRVLSSPFFKSLFN